MKLKSKIADSTSPNSTPSNPKLYLCPQQILMFQPTKHAKLVKVQFFNIPRPLDRSFYTTTEHKHFRSTFFRFSIHLICTHHTIELCLPHRRCCSLKCIYSRPYRIFGVYGRLKSLCRRTSNFLFLSSYSDHLKLSFRLMGVVENEKKREGKTTDMRVNKSNFILDLSAFYSQPVKKASAVSWTTNRSR